MIEGEETPVTSADRTHLRVLSEKALDRIEETAYRLLDEVGISLQHARATELLHGLGCRVEQGRVYIPHDAVQWALARIRPHKVFYERDGVEAFALGDGRVRFHSGGGLPFILDLDSGQRRRPTLADVEEATRLLDALPNVDMIIPLYGAQDVAPELQTIASTDVMLRNTRKPVWAAPLDRPQDVDYVVEMGAACCGGMDAFLAHPTMYLTCSPVSPLTFTEEGTATIIAIAESGTPLLPLPAPTLGATGPVTMAGTVALQHAETLATYTLAAAARPAIPVMYCSRISAIDPRTAVSIWGGPDIGLTGACAGQLAQRLGLASDTYGLTSSSALLDPQFGYERLSNALIPALAGVDVLSGVGSTADVMVAGPEIAVLDDEMAGLVKHIVTGCEVNETTLAYDVMASAIPRDGVFLGEMHTAKQMRKDALWIPGISTRSGRRDKADDGAPAESVVERARSRARELIRSHEAPPLPDDTRRHLDEILVRAHRELTKD
jgi:trimethylamine--corrinoid protein Co-methyltransferase